jgi:hypothetical protein
MFKFEGVEFEVYENARGKVASTSQRSDTHVSAPGSAIGGTQPISSTVTVNNELWLELSDGSQRQYTYTGNSFAASDHEVREVGLRVSKHGDQPVSFVLCLENLTSKGVMNSYVDSAIGSALFGGTFEKKLLWDFIFGILKTIKVWFFAGLALVLVLVLNRFVNVEDFFGPLILIVAIGFPIYQFGSYSRRWRRRSKTFCAAVVKDARENLGISVPI